MSLHHIVLATLPPPSVCVWMCKCVCVCVRSVCVSPHYIIFSLMQILQHYKVLLYLGGLGLQQPPFACVMELLVLEGLIEPPLAEYLAIYRMVGWVFGKLFGWGKGQWQNENEQGPFTMHCLAKGVFSLCVYLKLSTRRDFREVPGTVVPEETSFLSQTVLVLFIIPLETPV